MFGKKWKKERLELNQKIRALEQKLTDRKGLVDRNKELFEINSKLTDQLNSTRQKVREQMEADLFFVSQKICQELLSGIKKKELQLQLNMQEQLLQAPYPYAGLEGSLGNLIGCHPFNRGKC